MANPPTMPDIQTVAGATQFDGATGTTGLVEFSDYLATLGNNAARAKILSVTYNGTGGAAVQLDIWLQLAATPATVRIPLVGEADVITKVLMCGEGLWVPKSATTRQSWNLLCTTTGKTAPASLIVDWKLAIP